MEKKKIDVVMKACCLASFVLAFLVVALVYLDFGAFPKIRTDEMEKPDETLQWWVDGTGVSGTVIYINGWAAKLDEDISSFNCAVLLKDRATGVTRKLKTEMVNRQGISEALGTEHNIDNCGYIGYVKSSKLDGEAYQVCIWYGNNGHNILIETNTYIDAGGTIIETQ